jgi:hypothetical protein
MMFRKALGTLLVLVACLLSLAAPAFAQDMIDPSTIQIVNAPDFRGWKVAGRFSEITAQPGSVTFVVDGQSCDRTPQSCWPIVNASIGPIQFTIWLFVQINGQWVGSAFIEGVNNYNTTVGDNFGDYARDWYYCCRWNPMTGHVIQDGETIGFMFGGGDQRDGQGPNTGIRSNIVTIQATPGTHTFAPPPPKKTTKMDFDGDGKADIGVFRPATGQWFGLASSTNFTTSATLTFGGAGDIPVPGDYDGDGIGDVAVYRPSNGTWYIRYSSSGSLGTIAWGAGGDIPVLGDFDGDGKTDIAVFRPSDGTWYIVYSGTGTGVALVWGGAGDIPVPGDYDGDGLTDLAVLRPSDGTWYIRYTATPTSAALVWGGVGDIPVPGDYDGDGKTDIAVFRPSDGTWYIRYTATPTSAALVFGAEGDIPVPEDYDGDGLIDLAVYRPSNGTWYIRYSSTGALGSVQWGVSTDIPM